MKITYHPYELKIKHSDVIRKGALIRCFFPDTLIGYADCHPWVQFGDLPLEDQISKLLRGELTPLTKRTLEFARLDALGRLNKMNLIDPDKRVENHFLILNPSLFDEWDKLAFYKIVKIKLTGTAEDKLFLKLVSQKAPHLKWRLDFNAQISYKAFYRFISSIDITFIDFIEDPFPFDEALWASIEQEFSVALAADFEKNKLKKWLPKVVIVKPAVDDFSYYLSINSRIIITSYLGHPIEQLCSLYCAQQLANNETMGIFSHYIYEANAFSKLLDKTPTSSMMPGTGFGYDVLLSQLEWL